MLLHIQQTQGASHQHAVDPGIDLREITWFKRHGDAELRQCISQLRAPFVEQMNGLQPFGLQPPLHTGVQSCKRTQAVFITVTQGLQMAQHQRGHFITTGQLDLRAGLDGIHRSDQRAQRKQQGAHVRWQHGTFLHVSHVAALALVKADQHRALLVHVAHRQARAVAVTPGRTFDGAQDVIGTHFAQMPQIVFKHPLLHCHLCRHMQVLHFAATTGTGMQAKVGATGCDTLGRFSVNLGDRALLKVVFPAMHIGTD